MNAYVFLQRTHVILRTEILIRSLQPNSSFTLTTHKISTTWTTQRRYNTLLDKELMEAIILCQFRMESCEQMSTLTECHDCTRVSRVRIVFVLSNEPSWQQSCG